MNAERLNAIAIAIKADLKAKKILQLVTKLTADMANLSGSPGNQQYQTEVSNSRQALSNALLSSAINQFSPTWRQAVAELGLEDNLGRPLKERIDKIFDGNVLTHAAALKQLQQIDAALQTVGATIDQATSSLRQLGIGAETLGSGECEIGILVPRAFVANRLDKFANELSLLNKTLGVFSEIATGSRDGFKVRTISSSDLSVFLDSVPATCAVVAAGIERVVAIYKSLLEIRKLRKAMLDSGVPSSAMGDIDSHIDEHMSAGIKQAASELMEEFGRSSDVGRKNELMMDLIHSLRKIAIRIDHGFNFEVRMCPPEKSSDESEGSNEAAIAAERSHERIAAAAENLRFLKLEGDPILQIGSTEDLAGDERAGGDSPKP